MVKVIWDLTKPLSERKINEKIIIKPIGKEQLRIIGEILVVTWRGFIRTPEDSVNYLWPFVEAGVEQPFIAYLKDKPVGCVSPRLDRKSNVGVLDGGVHVLPEYRRQHIGTTLLFTALKWLKQHGMEKAWVRPWNLKES